MAYRTACFGSFYQYNIIICDSLFHNLVSRSKVCRIKCFFTLHVSKSGDLKQIINILVKILIWQLGSNASSIEKGISEEVPGLLL